MDSYISENRGLLLLGAFASLGVLFLSWPDRPNSTIEAITVGGSPEELITEANVDDFEDAIHGWAAREDRKLLPRDRIAEAGETRRLILSPSPYSVPAQTASARVAETAYEIFWEEFIENMDLSDEPTVRAIITEWHQFNLELIFAQREGDITFHELSQSVLSVKELHTRLTPHLTASQLVDVVVNFDTFSDYITGQKA